jgi:hypothetical protein
MTIALLTIVLVLAAFWLLYREPPKQRPGEALGKFDRVAQRIHDVVQGRWYGKVAATVVVLAAGFAVAQVFSSDTLTTSTSTRTVTVASSTPQTVTVTVSTPTDPSSTVPTTTTAPEPDTNHSVIGTWSGIVVDEDDKSNKYRLSLTVETTKVDVETVGSATVTYFGSSKCFFTITAAGQEANAFSFSSNGSTTDTNPGCSSTIDVSVERKTDDTVVVTTDYGGSTTVGTLRRS